MYTGGIAIGIQPQILSSDGVGGAGPANGITLDDGTTFITLDDGITFVTQD